MTSPFQYTPLQDPAHEIRLLCISSGKPLACTLSTHKLRGAPNFRAISYAWGDERHLQKILVDGYDFVVRENCLCVLRQARRHLPHDMPIWLDAICVNQADNEEKGHQVAIMRDIYAQAASVLVSVGEHYDDSQFLYDRAAWFQMMIAIPIDEKCHWCELASTASKKPESRLFHEGELHTYHNWVDAVSDKDYAKLASAYRRFANRPYWRRVWVLQETFYARQIDVACGRSIDRLRSIEFIQRLMNYAPKNKDDFIAADTADRALAVHRNRDFFEFLWSRCVQDERNAYRVLNDLSAFIPLLHEYQCANVRDKIYGILGMVDWGATGPPKPDYLVDPLDLAVDVMGRVGMAVIADPDDEAQHGFAFPHHVAHLLKALGERQRAATDLHLRGVDLPANIDEAARFAISVSSAASCSAHRKSFEGTRGAKPGKACQKAAEETERLVLRHKSNDPSMDRKRASDTDPRPVKSLSWVSDFDPLFPRSARRTEPNMLPRGEPSPLVADEIQRLLREYGRQEEDVVVDLSRTRDADETRKDRIATHFCLVLRKVTKHYYEILDEAPKVNAVLFPNEDVDEPEGGNVPVWLCLDSRDAASLALALDQLESRIALGDALAGERHSLADKSHLRMRMSSYAIDKEPRMRAFDTWSIFSQTPCARCGGMLDGLQMTTKPRANKESLGYAHSGSTRRIA